MNARELSFMLNHHVLTNHDAEIVAEIVNDFLIFFDPLDEQERRYKAEVKAIHEMLTKERSVNPAWIVEQNPAAKLFVMPTPSE